MRPSRITLLLGLGLSLGLLASCNDNDLDSDRTVAAVAKQEIAQNTTEVDDPIVINDLSLSGRDTTDTNLPGGI